MSAGFALVASLAATVDTNWPQFRGPNASGIAEGFPAPATWDLQTGRNVLWNTLIPGLGHASPIIWGNRVYVATSVKPGEAALKVGLYGETDSVIENEPHQWRLLALNRLTGAIDWNALAHEGVPRQRRHPKSSHCNSTPATDGEHIVAVLGSEGMFCFGTDGTLRWRKRLGPMDAGPYTDPAEQWGFGSSPVIHQGRVIVQCDALSEQYLAAFDVRNGRELWRQPRKEVATWSTPTVVVGDARTQIIVNGWRHQGGYCWLTGQELWRLSGGGDAPIPTPVVAHGLVYLTGAHGRNRPLRAVRLEATGDITPTDLEQTNAAIAWVHPQRGNYLQTPLVLGDELYACTDYGLVTCLEARTGRIHYSERLRGSSQGFAASPVAADGKIYFTGEQGEVFVLRAGQRFEVLATNRLDEVCLATPAISSGCLFFRARGHMIAITGRP